MPYYEYRCTTNGRTLEVRHGMDERLATWGELAGLAGVAIGSTPTNAPVDRLLSTPVPPAGGTSAAGARTQGCGAGCGCARRSNV